VHIHAENPYGAILLVKEHHQDLEYFQIHQIGVLMAEFGLVSINTKKFFLKKKKSTYLIRRGCAIFFSDRFSEN
jgi:hypothetical protein